MARLLGVPDAQVGRLARRAARRAAPALPGAVRASVGLGTTAPTSTGWSTPCETSPPRARRAATARRRARRVPRGRARYRRRAISEHVYKSVEITGSSPEGVTQAIDRAIAKASESLRHLDWFELMSVQPVRQRQGHPLPGDAEDRLEGRGLSRRLARARAPATGCRSRSTSFSGATTITAPGGRQLGQVGELGEAVLAGAEQEVVDRERRVEAARRARVGADGLDAEADDRAPPPPASARTRRRGRACAAAAR